ncbi:ShlB/FhaC/HecB family hemolysin secretion/activation protein, partial [Pantoea sp. DY-15]|uniref:POTRA domain-containing protein n=1 Tax=Pantoea sp. DY-15 TaxID=2871489 RepID=UPI00272CF70B
MMAKTGMSLALSVGLITTSALAAPLNPGDRDYIQNQQQQRLQNDQQQRDALWNATAPQSTPAADSAQAGPCFPVQHIAIRNVTLISAGQQQSLAAPYIHRCLNLTEINSLVHAISDWYMQRGYITSRAFLIEQDLSQGELIIPVLEGKLDA